MTRADLIKQNEALTRQLEIAVKALEQVEYLGCNDDMCKPGKPHREACAYRNAKEALELIFQPQTLYRMLCLKCKSKAFHTAVEPVAQVYRGREMVIQKTEVSKCSKCGWITLNDDQVDLLYKAVKNL